MFSEKERKSLQTYWHEISLVFSSILAAQAEQASDKYHSVEI